MFAHGRVVVFDLEWTSWPGFQESAWSMPGRHREIVQIGAVALDADFTETDAFEVMARPRLDPRLSPYFTALTGITQARLERHAIPFADALAGFTAFIGADADVASWGRDADVVGETCAIAGLPCPSLFEAAIDLGPPIKRRLGFEDETVSSSDLAPRLGIAVAGRAHDALHDARCVAAALRVARRRGRL
jgi:DNA polymerase III epsilon subunit-like protein